MSWIKTDVEAESKERIARPEFIVQQLLRVVLTAPRWVLSCLAEFSGAQRLWPGKEGQY